ncbi:MAG TPA: hypothetical protein VII02_05005 [Gemmatimonadaceae bacterium]
MSGKLVAKAIDREEGENRARHCTGAFAPVIAVAVASSRRRGKPVTVGLDRAPRLVQRWAMSLQLCASRDMG